MPQLERLCVNMSQMGAALKQARTALHNWLVSDNTYINDTCLLKGMEGGRTALHCGRRVLGAEDGAADTSHHRHKTSSSSQVIIVSLWRIPGGARDVWASSIFVSFLFTSLVALLKYLPSTNTNNSV